MPTADLRALAERLDVLKTCDGCDGDGDFDGKLCPACGDRGWRLPTESEVREAIFEAGFGLTIYASRTHASVEARTARLLKSLTASAHATEVAPDDLVLLALMRALEACRG